MVLKRIALKAAENGLQSESERIIPVFIPLSGLRLVFNSPSGKRVSSTEGGE